MICLEKESSKQVYLCVIVGSTNCLKFISSHLGFSGRDFFTERQWGHVHLSWHRGIHQGNQGEKYWNPEKTTEYPSGSFPRKKLAVVAMLWRRSEQLCWRYLSDGTGCKRHLPSWKREWQEDGDNTLHSWRGESLWQRVVISEKGVEKGWAVAVGAFEPGFAPCP